MTVFYELCVEVRVQDAPRLREGLTVVDPFVWARACFDLDFAALCLSCRWRDGLLYAQPSRTWHPAPPQAGAFEVRLLALRRVMPETLAHNLVSAKTRAAAGEVLLPIQRRPPAS
jgi:hypothetical protein